MFSTQRVDPNRIFWQRNADAPAVSIIEDDLEPTSGASDHEGEEESSSSSSSGEESGGDSSSGTAARTTTTGTSTARRPPSYVSEDGVSYLIEARPRSTVPQMVGPEIVPMPMPLRLPVHPSESGRVATPLI